ncbi:MAG: alkene reductase [Gemmatimonadota bacterium]|nr:alkene reductase [Gemmatimonadota bacterium]
MDHQLLLDAYNLGSLVLPNRMVMCPLTRNRAAGGVPNEMMRDYYVQRSTAGLIITEGTQVAALGQGYQDTPGIYTDEQGAGWRMITDAVHEAGGRIFAQLWHVGRVSHSYYHGQQPVAPSPISPPGNAYTPEGPKPFETPHELTIQEIERTVGEFRRAASVARNAGFDGVELHGANGYLIDQFLQSGTNQRTDRFGGSPENRTRFLMGVLDAVAEVWPSDRIGVRLSPGGGMSGIHDDDPVETFTHVAEALGRRGLAYVHVVEAPIGTNGPDERHVCSTELIRGAYRGTLISAGGYNPGTAERALQQKKADLIAFGRLFIANPDLVARVGQGAPLNEPDRTTFYTAGPHGYVDYPTLAPAEV